MGRRWHSIDRIIGKLDGNERPGGDVFWSHWKPDCCSQRWCPQGDRFRSHGSLGYNSLAPDAILGIPPLRLEGVSKV